MPDVGCETFMQEEWVLLIEAESDLEAAIIGGLMAEHGIPIRREDSSPYTGAMRVIGGMAYEVRLMVPGPLYEQAKQLLASLEDDQ
jgi:hypothetical protein